MTQCLQCGYCCIAYSVVIIKPEAIDKKGNVNLKNRDNYIFKGTYAECPHLRWEDDGKAHCSIHHLKWYKKTPCYQHNNNLIKEPCKMGDYHISNGVDRDKFKEMRKLYLEHLKNHGFKGTY